MSQILDFFHEASKPLLGFIPLATTCAVLGEAGTPQGHSVLEAIKVILSPAVGLGIHSEFPALHRVLGQAATAAKSS